MLGACRWLFLWMLLVGGQLSTRCRNLTGRKLKLYWVNFENKPQLNEIMKPGGETYFGSYEGHRFFFGEYSGPAVPISSPGVVGAEFTVSADTLIYAVRDKSSPAALVEKHLEEMKFLKEYRDRTGEIWISTYPRAPPIFKLWPADFVGQTHQVSVTGEASQWLCAENVPSCRAPTQVLTLKAVTLKPRAFLVEHFLSDFECDQVLEFHRPRMKRSTVGQGENQVFMDTRTSMSDRMERTSYPIAEAIYRRLALALALPHEVLHNNRSAESINVVSYAAGQEYTAHYDTISDGTKTDYRFISPLLYFNTPIKGGSTFFPKAGSNETGVHVPAVKGNLMFFYDLLEDGNIDTYSVHAGTPVEEGEKWIGAAWVWEPQLDFGSSSKEELATFSAQQHAIMKQNLEKHTEL